MCVGVVGCCGSLVLYGVDGRWCCTELMGVGVVRS